MPRDDYRGPYITHREHKIQEQYGPLMMVGLCVVQVRFVCLLLKVTAFQAYLLTIVDVSWYKLPLVQKLECQYPK